MGWKLYPRMRLRSSDKSIAVIPFVNMSNDPDQEYFSDGMMQEIILNHLFKDRRRTESLTSRTSVDEVYKGSDKSSPVKSLVNYGWPGISWRVVFRKSGD